MRSSPLLWSSIVLLYSSGDERIRQETLRDQVYVCATVKVVKTTLRVARYCDNLTRSRSRRVEHRKCVVQRNLHTPNGDEIAQLIVRELSATGSILQSLEIQLQRRVNVYASVRIIQIKVSPSLEKDTNQKPARTNLYGCEQTAFREPNPDSRHRRSVSGNRNAVLSANRRSALSEERKWVTLARYRRSRLPLEDTPTGH